MKNVKPAFWKIPKCVVHNGTVLGKNQIVFGIKILLGKYRLSQCIWWHNLGRERSKMAIVPPIHWNISQNHLIQSFPDHLAMLSRGCACHCTLTVRPHRAMTSSAATGWQPVPVVSGRELVRPVEVICTTSDYSLPVIIQTTGDFQPY